jgi:23S rRNA (uracil1939-C5)-methyltransferase
VALRVRLVAPRKPRPELEWDDAGEGVAEWQELYAEGELRLSLDCPGENADSPAQVEEMAYLPGDFTQTNWEVNSALVSRALAWLRPRGDERALDLFSGIGNFALPLARRAAAVDALEGDASMTARLDENAARNGISNIRARTVNLMAAAPVLPRADIAIIDPPRAGAKAVCEALPRTGVKRLVYVSCHPATLARDARGLQAAGFKLLRAAAVDMFPHTGHSEAIALFERVSKR